MEKHVFLQPKQAGQASCANGWLGLILLFICVHGCTNIRNGLAGNKPPHDHYREQLIRAGLDQTQLGKFWLNAAEKSLREALTVKLPYSERGYFAADNPLAAGLSFEAKAGDIIHISLTLVPSGRGKLFADLWQINSEGTNAWITSTDSSLSPITYEVKNDNRFVCRVQPELLVAMEYKLEISTGPSLAFPVPEGNHPRAGSFWGDNRDNGGRKHEGVDIFGKFRTPVVAAAPGTISQVTQNRLGGKVVFLRPDNKGYQLYYAHLDTQWVSNGDYVQTGDTLGLMGNTGNARNTPPHLHFGIYGSGGALDPYPFINLKRAPVPPIPESENQLNRRARVGNQAKLLQVAASGLSGAPLEQNTPVTVVAIGESFCRVLLPDERQGFVQRKYLSRAGSPIKKEAIAVSVKLLDRPDTAAATVHQYTKETTVEVLGVYNGYRLVQDGNRTGWVAANQTEKLK